MLRIGFHTSDEWGALLENVVCIELLRRGMEVFYYAQKGECDFIARSQGGQFKAFQVTLSMADEKTRQREIAGVAEAMQAFQLNEGWILTMEDSEDIVVEGRTIHVMPVWQFL
jgi:predicted AAA+ superfamily ATPase